MLNLGASIASSLRSKRFRRVLVARKLERPQQVEGGGRWRGIVLFCARLISGWLKSERSLKSAESPTETLAM